MADAKPAGVKRHEVEVVLLDLETRGFVERSSSGKWKITAAGLAAIAKATGGA